MEAHSACSLAGNADCVIGDGARSRCLLGRAGDLPTLRSLGACVGPRQFNRSLPEPVVGVRSGAGLFGGDVSQTTRHIRV